MNESNRKISMLNYGVLVSMWCNMFLPSAKGGGKLSFVESAGIMYLEPTMTESILKDTVHFMLERIHEISSRTGSVVVVVEEPKPIDIVETKMWLTSMARKTMAIEESNMVKILHLANRRYMFQSNSVLFPGDGKEMDMFVDRAFSCMMDDAHGKGIGWARFNRLRNARFKDFYSSAKSAIPSSMWFHRDVVDSSDLCLNPEVEVVSTNDILDRLIDTVAHPSFSSSSSSSRLDSSMSKFLRIREDEMKRDAIHLASSIM